MKKTLGNKICESRKSLGLTQEDLAEKLGVSPQAVSKWENDISCPDITYLPDIAGILKTTIDELLSSEPKKAVELLPEEKRCSADDKVLRIIVQDGDNVNINLPVPLIKLMISSGANLGSISGNKLKNVDMEQLLSLIENGVIGTLLEITENDGSVVKIVVE